MKLCHAKLSLILATPLLGQADQDKQQQVHAAPLIPALREALQADNAAGRINPTRLRVFIELGPKAAAASDDLLDALAHAEGREAAMVLRAIACVAPFAKGGQRPYLDRMHRLTARLIGKHRPPGGEAIAEAFVRALVRLRRDWQDLSPAQLIEFIKTDTVLYRAWAAQLLISRGKRCPAAVPLLTKALQHPTKGGYHDRQGAFAYHRLRVDDGFADLAAKALIVVGEAAEHIPAHLHFLATGDAATRSAAAAALGSLRRPEAVSGLIALARDARPEVAQEAILVLGNLGRHARAALPLLDELSAHRTRRIAVPAQHAAARIRRVQ